MENQQKILNAGKDFEFEVVGSEKKYCEKCGRYTLQSPSKNGKQICFECKKGEDRGKN